jgi:hypothetical protein
VGRDVVPSTARGMAITALIWTGSVALWGAIGVSMTAMVVDREVLGIPPVAAWPWQAMAVWLGVVVVLAAGLKLGGRGVILAFQAQARERMPGLLEHYGAAQTSPVEQAVKPLRPLLAAGQDEAVRRDSSLRDAAALVRAVAYCGSWTPVVAPVICAVCMIWEVPSIRPW